MPLRVDSTRERTKTVTPSRITVVILLAAFAVGVNAQTPAVELGTIDFPTSAKPAAQAPFLTGMKALYNFEFDIAAEAFQQAQKADPAFALAYWGEAMSYNHPLWAQQDLAAARRVLERLAPTAAARAAKAPAGKERDLIEAEDILFGAGDKLARDIAYSKALERMHATYPDDDEIACMYALALLGTGRAGEKNTRTSMQAAAIAQGIFQRHPQHPGSAHFIIHAFDDPDHAILALPAARAYSKIAPAAAHAVHMPSHIFVQLGMWDDVIASNVIAYKAAVDLAEKKNLPRGREDFHTLSWLQYAYLQEGKFDEAQRCVEMAKAVADKDTAPNVRDGYASMKARQIAETDKFEKLPLTAGPVRDGGAPSYDGSSAYVFAAGVSAANLDDPATANVALEKLTATRTQAESGSNAYRARPFAIMEKELAAVIAFKQKDTATAERLLKEATAIELTLDPPSGPADPIKPSFELYGMLLANLNRPAEAAAQFQQALTRMPNRRAALEGLKRATAKTTTTSAGR
jgi:tetratricopeptide (TPR) repeat protein